MYSRTVVSLWDLMQEARAETIWRLAALLGQLIVATAFPSRILSRPPWERCSARWDFLAFNPLCVS